ncbi:MAG TPA: hypothetical protein EYH36_03855 [Desulfocapsa sulfexigens]|nr:hypothetical protein [Desulfocapsa sulfexigens]
MKESKILITNDDGIESPGLKAAVEADLALGTPCPKLVGLPAPGRCPPRLLTSFMFMITKMFA